MSEPPSPRAGAPEGRSAVDWLLRSRSTGRITVGQWPNAALGVWVVAAITARLDVLPGRRDEIGWIGTGALIAWAADELLRGVNPLRRALGLLVLGWQIYRLVG